MTIHISKEKLGRKPLKEIDSEIHNKNWYFDWHINKNSVHEYSLTNKSLLAACRFYPE